MKLTPERRVSKYYSYYIRAQELKVKVKLMWHLKLLNMSQVHNHVALFKYMIITAHEL